ncbi:hypothetical protein B9Z55_012917 [Caenorhabditis nigoni]|uniref:F-box domain-containing protein n=1 Tax=Caenorhabditis nigoni TaxID=1611254 RepID=A0A2G5TZC8_9PELO|nr:hypothetical protein B9Z55_012917 [Caenorhabditis nigoni]
MYRSRRARSIENLIKTIEKLSIDPVYDTNWSDMSDDIKLKCIGKLEFKERLSLRCTAKEERSLVDSQKIKFNRGRFWGDEEDLGFQLYCDNKKMFSKCLEDINDGFELMKYIKKIGVFENLVISFENSLTNHEQFMTDDGLFTAKTVEFEHGDVDNVIAVLRKLKNTVESIEIDSEITTSDEFAKLLAISNIRNVPYWHIQDYEQTDSLHKVAQMWIHTKAKVGSTFQVSVNKNSSFHEFWEHFIDRIVSKTDKRVRIRTNDPDHHILLERGFDEVVEIGEYLTQYFRLMVITAEMNESEYNDDCKEWILKLDPEIYDEYDSDNSFDNLDDFYHEE